MGLERKKGLTFSGVLHVVLIALIVFGLPTLFMMQPPEEPMAVTVDILPVAKISNVRPSAESPTQDQKDPPKEEKKEEQKPELKEPVKENKPKPSPIVKTETPPPPPKPEEKEKKEEKKPEEKKPEKPPEPKKEEKQKPTEDPLDAILKSVKDTASSDVKPTPKEEKKETGGKKGSRSTNFDPNSPEALSIRDSIANQVYKCWNVPAGVRDAEQLVVLVEVEYDQAGNPTSVKLADESKSKAASNPAYNAAAGAATRAVQRCAPLQGMAPENYHIWSYVVIRFDPKDIL